MQEMFLGEAIRRRRLELGLPQEELCEGICQPITVSRLENGRQTPSRNTINALLERLDMPADRYHALLSKNEMEVDALQREVTSYNVRFQNAPEASKGEIRREALACHEKLLSVADPDDTLSRQLIARSRVILGREDGLYSFQEEVSLLLEAIRMTSPHFALDSIGSGLYTMAEIKIINQIAVAYSVAGEHIEALTIWNQLYKWMNSHFHNFPPTRAHLNMILFNYARELSILGQREKAIEIALEGKRLCLNYGHYYTLPGLLSILAKNYHLTGNDEKSRALYLQSYFTALAIEDQAGADSVREDAWTYLSMEMPD